MLVEGRDTGEEEASMSVSRKMRGFMHDVQNILEPLKKEKQVQVKYVEIFHKK